MNIINKNGSVMDACRTSLRIGISKTCTLVTSRPFSFHSNASFTNQRAFTLSKHVAFPRSRDQPCYIKFDYLVYLVKKWVNLLLFLLSS